MSELVILAAGRASRLGGRNKLLVDAGGRPVYEWHRDIAGDLPVSVVVRPADASTVAMAVPWDVVVHDRLDGPAGALRAFLAQRTRTGPLIVLFADTLLRELPRESGCWVGIAPMPGRAWDYLSPSLGMWVRGVPDVAVCVGAYRFCNVALLASVLEGLLASADDEVPMATVLREYGRRQWLMPLEVSGWQDAGDPEAIARVVP